MSYAGFEQVINDLHSLVRAIEDIRQKLVTECGVPYKSQDARHVALDGLQCDIGACGIWIATLMSLKNISQEKLSLNWENEYRKLLRTDLCSGTAEDLMLDYLRNTLTTKVHFKIENLFSNILTALRQPPPKGFWNISNAMLYQAGISTDGSDKNTLTVLANLRNSYHANGMHNKSNLSADSYGIRFEFCQGKRVECASWKHIVMAIRANVSVLDAILFSGTVSNLRGEIPDDFAASMNP